MFYSDTEIRILHSITLNVALVYFKHFSLLCIISCALLHTLFQIMPSYVKCCTPVFQMFVSVSSNVALRCFRVTFWNLPFWKSLCRMLLFLWLLNRIFLVMGHAMIHEWTVDIVWQKWSWVEMSTVINLISYILLSYFSLLIGFSFKDLSVVVVLV